MQQQVNFDSEVDLNGKVNVDLNLSMPRHDPVAVTLSIISLVISIVTAIFITLNP